MENALALIRAEIIDADTALANATREEAAAGYEIEATMAREYFTGRLEGLKTALYYLLENPEAN